MLHGRQVVRQLKKRPCQSGNFDGASSSRLWYEPTQANDTTGAGERKAGDIMARTKGLPAGFRRKKDKAGNETGRLEYRFTIGRERYSVTGSSVAECRELETLKRQQVAEHSYIRNDRITVEQYFDEWMKAKAGTVKESTLFTSAVEFRPVLDRIGQERVSTLERRQVIALQADLAQTYTTRGVNYRIGLLKSVLKAAVMDDIILKNPCEGIKPLKRIEPQASETIHRAMTQEEQGIFFRAAARSWYFELFQFLIQTGVRNGEACALKWSDVDYGKGVIHIRRTLMHTKKGFVMGRETKSRAGMRDIPITEDIRDTLRRQREKVQAVFGGRLSLDGCIFLNMQGDMIYPGSVYTSMKNICNRVGLEPLGVHAFRDTFATRCIEQGMNPQTLKTILGHSSLAMTMDLYAHVLPNTKAEEMSKIRIIV